MLRSSHWDSLHMRYRNGWCVIGKARDMEPESERPPQLEFQTPPPPRETCWSTSIMGRLPNRTACDSQPWMLNLQFPCHITPLRLYLFKADSDRRRSRCSIPLHAKHSAYNSNYTLCVWHKISSLVTTGRLQTHDSAAKSLTW